MTSFRSMLAVTITTGTLLALTASPARADDRTLFVWSGTVDREAVIVMRGANVDTQGDGFESSRDARVRIAEALPRTNGMVRVQRADGRGEVDVIEQPTAFNGYTTRVRIRDRQSGADRYRLTATWDGGRDVIGYGRGDDARRGDDCSDDRRGDDRRGDDCRGDDRSDDRRGDDRRGDDRRGNDRRGDDRSDDRNDDRRGDDRYDDRRDDDRKNRGGWGNGRGNGNGNGRGNGNGNSRGNGNGRGNENGNGRGNGNERDDIGSDARDAGGLRFSASVDDAAEIRIRGRRVNVVTRSGRRLSDVRYDVRGAGLPDYARPLDLRRFAGRGNVVITQYPRAWNDWTAVVRIDDSRGGPDNYDFDLRW